MSGRQALLALAVYLVVRLAGSGWAPLPPRRHLTFAQTWAR
jgi:hypothetical protein